MSKFLLEVRLITTKHRPTKEFNSKQDARSARESAFVNGWVSEYSDPWKEDAWPPHEIACISLSEMLSVVDHNENQEAPKSLSRVARDNQPPEAFER